MIEIESTNRPTARQLVTLAKGKQSRWQSVLDMAEVFVTAREDGVLVGFSHAHGDGTTWLVQRLFVAEDYRGEGVGTDIRKRVILECSKLTVSTGRMYGFYDEDVREFWENPDLTGTTSQPIGFTGVRIIEGHLR